MAWTLIAHMEATGSGSASTFTSGSINTTGADLVVVAAINGVGGHSGFTLSDSKSNTWLVAEDNTATSNQFDGVTIFYVQGGTVGSGHTFTMTATGGNFAGARVVSAWSGSQASPVDQKNTAAGNSTIVQAGSITPGSNNELIIAAVANTDAVNSVSVNQSFVISDQVVQTNGQNIGAAMAYLEQGTAAAVNPTWTGTSTLYNPTIVSFEAAAAPAAAPPVLPAEIILHQFGFDAAFQIGSPSSAGVNATASAGVANVSVGAYNPTVAVTATGTGNGAVTVAALQPTGAVTATGTGVANVTVAAYNPTAAVTGLPGNAAATVAALQPVPAVTAFDQTGAAVTVGALNPTGTIVNVSLTPPVTPAELILHQFGFDAAFQVFPPTAPAGIVNVTPGVANVTVAALNPTAAVTGLPDTPNVTAAGLQPTPLVTGFPAVANVTVAGLQPTGLVTAFPGAANITVTAYNPSVSTGSNVNAAPGVAAVTVAANGATITATVTATGVAAVTIAAYNPGTGRIPGVANVTAAAAQPTITVLAVPGAAPVVVAGWNPVLKSVPVILSGSVSSGTNTGTATSGTNTGTAEPLGTLTGETFG